MLKKIGQNYQIALPRKIVKLLRLRVNDYLDVQVKDNRVILEPQVMLPKDQAYFYTPEWHKEESEAEKDIREGRVTKTNDLKGLFKKLDE